MTQQFYMRGYNTAAPGTVGYVNWVVNDVPDTTGVFLPSPYSISNITGITVNRVVTSKIQNFLKSVVEPSFISNAYNNPQDGYLFHLNSYDWLNPIPTGGSGPIIIPSASQPIGVSVVRGSASSGSPFTPSAYASLYWEEGLGAWSFSFINPNGTIGTALPVSMGALELDGYLAVTDISSDLVAQSGIIRIPDNQFIKSRNAGNSADLALIGTDSSNNIIIGNTTATFNATNTFIAGNLTVLGTTTTVDSTTVDIVGRVIHGNWADPTTSPNVGEPTLITGYNVHRGNVSGVPRDSAGLIWTEGSLTSGADGYWRLATITQDNDNVLPSALANPLNLLAGSVSVASSPNPTLGTLPGVGGLRTQNNTTAVSARNAAGTADHLLLGTDAADHITMGATSSPHNAGFIFNTTTGSVFDFWVNTVSQIQLGNGDIDADGYVETIQVSPTVNSPKLYQLVQSSTGTNNGFNFLVQAQAGQQQSGVNNNNNGGNLILAGGAAGTGGSGTAGTVGAVVIASKLQLNGGFRRHITAVTSGPYTILSTDDYIAVGTLLAPLTINMPASPTIGDTYEIKDTNASASSNNITISGNGNNIDGASTFVISINYASIKLTFTTTQWSIG